MGLLKYVAGDIVHAVTGQAFALRRVVNRPYVDHNTRFVTSLHLFGGDGFVVNVKIQMVLRQDVEQIVPEFSD